MGGNELPVIGFDKHVFMDACSAILERGQAEMIRNAGDAEAFQSAYDRMDMELQQLAEACSPPEAVAQKAREKQQSLVNSLIEEHDVDLTPLYMARVRKACALILQGIKTRNVPRIDRIKDEALASLVDSGHFTYRDAADLVAELSMLECKNLRQMLEHIGKSRNTKYARFLAFLEDNGLERMKEPVARAKGELLSTTSRPLAKVVEIPHRVRPKPLRRIR